MASIVGATAVAPLASASGSVRGDRRRGGDVGVGPSRLVRISAARPARVASAMARGPEPPRSVVYDASAGRPAILDIPHWHSRKLIEDGRVFSETFPVRFDEVGPDKQSTMRTVASMIQECACNHAQGIWGRAQSMPAEMRDANLAWVCTRLHIDVESYPRWGDQVEVRTWFEAQGRIAARRDWEMRCTSDGSDGRASTPVGKATSQWIAFNLEKRKLARIPQSVIDQFESQALKGCVVMGEEYDAAEKLPDVRGMPGLTLPKSHSVRRSDLDMNQHVNNVVYTEWLLESVPEHYWSDYQLKELILEFRNECHLGDNVDAVCCRECGEEGVLECEERPGEIKLVHMLLKRGFSRSPRTRRWCERGRCGTPSLGERDASRRGTRTTLKKSRGGRQSARPRARARLVPCNDPKRVRDRLFALAPSNASGMPRDARETMRGEVATPAARVKLYLRTFGKKRRE